TSPRVDYERQVAGEPAEHREKDIDGSSAVRTVGEGVGGDRLGGFGVRLSAIERRHRLGEVEQPVPRQSPLAGNMSVTRADVIENGTLLGVRRGHGGVAAFAGEHHRGPIYRQEMRDTQTGAGA